MTKWNILERIFGYKSLHKFAILVAIVSTFLCVTLQSDQFHPMTAVLIQIHRQIFHANPTVENCDFISAQLRAPLNP
jgi:hypothetical protein